ncbi:TetR/AcrR family transcriptional regulator [Alicyclobacillus sp.]|uniref:TetR/AcrR family transcriptional regulator n=1 Tax=Alicyclobacillus sp. TaxID=61169 RepID=UPI0025BC2C5A|nr:TetR/AcrR family transcriptional regulator [Alicyclobacillus sp.]MCL6516801.1 TetR/AcrR family transcriptional regulator [Alicyclobacillus sp.]
MSAEGRRLGRPRANEVDVPAADRIIRTAARLFLEQGYDAVTTETVASCSGVTKAMVYYYYGSKTNLFTAAIEWMMDISRARTQEILMSGGRLRDRLHTIAVTRLRIAAPLDVDAILRGTRSTLTEEQLARIHQAEERMVSVIADAFAEAARAGELRAVDPLLAARVFLALLMVGKMEQKQGRLPEERVEAWCTEVMDLFWCGVSADPAAIAPQGVAPAPSVRAAAPPVDHTHPPHPKGEE